MQFNIWFLKNRKKTHGEYEKYAKVSETLYNTLHLGRRYVSRDSIINNETTKMICSKIARICTGDAAFKDHWKDISGYATRAMEYYEKRYPPFKSRIYPMPEYIILYKHFLKSLLKGNNAEYLVFPNTGLLDYHVVRTRIIKKYSSQLPINLEAKLRGIYLTLSLTRYCNYATCHNTDFIIYQCWKLLAKEL